MLFALRTQHERSWNISTAIEQHPSYKAFLNYGRTDWSLHAGVSSLSISEHVLFILALLCRLLAFVSRSLITRFLISGEMHASLTLCVPASAPVTDRFIDNILHSIIYPDHSWYAGDMRFHEPIIRVWTHWVIDERWKLHQLVSYTLSSLLSEHRRSF